MKKVQFHEVVGYLLIVIAACFWGGSASLGKSILQKGLSTLLLMEVRSVVTCFLSMFFLLIFARQHLRISAGDLPGLILLGLPGLALVNGSYYYAVKVMPVAIAVFIQFTAPALIFLYGLLTGKEKVTGGKFAALVLSIAGTYFMLMPGSVTEGRLPIAGLLSAVVATFSYAFYVILSHKLSKRLSSWTLMFYGYAFASIFWCLIQPPSETVQLLIQEKVWLRATLFAIFSTLIPFSLFLFALRRVSPTGAAITSTSETISATLFAFFFLGERLSVSQMGGGVLIIVSIFLLILQRREMAMVQEEPVA